MTFNDSISSISEITSVKYVIPSETKEVIHEANSKIVVNAINDQIVTGTKRFLDYNIPNTNCTGKIELGQDNKGKALVTLSSESVNIGGSFKVIADQFTLSKKSNGAGITIDQYEMSKNSSFDTFNIGNSTWPMDNIYAKNLSDGTTTKSMTEVLSGTTEEWTFTLSDGTTVTKKVKLGA